MNCLSDGRLVDMMSRVDLCLLEDDFLEEDLKQDELVPKEKQEGRKKLAVISGIAAGSVALTGVIVFLVKKREVLRRAA